MGQARPVALPPDFDPLADLDAPLTGPTQPDHASPLEQSFRVPVPTQSLPPDLDDWDLDLSAPSTPAARVPGPFAEHDVPDKSFAPPAASPQPMRQQAAPPVPPPVPRPAPLASMAPPVATPAEAGDLMAAFLRGAGMPEGGPADPLAAMEALGAAFRAGVAGLRQALIARAAVKGEFRIERTMLKSRGNNPLKFSADDDDALAALLGIGRRSDMSPAEAVADALRDMRLHELATMAAMQAAVRALLARLDPAPLRAEGERSGGLLAAQKRAHAFEAYEKLHGAISRAISDDFDSVFGKNFALAYEQALREAAGKEGL
jgi:type VI secretion system protein ImpI/type VI secretion system protein